MPRWTGKSCLDELPRFYLDQCIAHQIGDALALVEYPISTPESTDNVHALDEELIPWLAGQGYVWITIDDAAKREHRDRLIHHDLSVLWVRGLAHRKGRQVTSVEKKSLNMEQVFIVLATQLPKLQPLLAKEMPRHRVDFLLYFNGARPSSTPYTPWQERRAKHHG